ncbi:replicative DNA helicase [Sphingomonas hankyongi]|uniref:Replicative DNA helicase n=1 Tax=Sphingomonas hankyongi TaxID=2908209 RepID=A0ABT0S1E3_9SPHN|nr:replicative DNA helicase [Sphingomonas hankyongi]MCL6729612.1 replicative DNA helicase [Sphingomonas hankyongi]
MAQVVHLAESASESAVQALPQNVEAEAALLGALMIDNRLIEDVQLKLRPQHFFEPLHARIYEAILRLTDKNMVANPVTLKPLFDSDEAMKQVGGPAYLAQLTGSGAAVIGARDFAVQIYDLALLRALVGVGRDLVEGALDTSEEVAPLAQIERAETELYKVAEEGGAEGKAKSFAEATREALEMAEKALNSGGHLSGFTTGLEALNSKIGGLHKSDLIIVAGRPGMGKSALGTNMAFAAAQRFLRDTADGIEASKAAGAPAALFSLEMSADQLATRILSEQSGITSEALRTGRISQQEFRELARAAAELENLPLYIDDTPGLTIAALRTRARRLKRQKNIGLIVVDYLQLLHGTGRGGGNENRVQEISEISRGLKTLAKELDVPVIGLSQLSRAVEQREDKRPQLSDLRESGSIEQDADIVLFIYREDYYLKAFEPDYPMPNETDKLAKYEEWNAKYSAAAGKAEVIVAKQRHGSTGIVRVRFDGRTTKFSDAADEGYMPELRG